ncbi:MAG: flavin reductase family protein [Janthinobacterium lividum]
MTIHTEHPFADAADDRSPLRRFRGRMVSPVSVWTALGEGRRAGWTVSSFLVADGEPGEVVGVVDEDSDLGELLAHPQADAAVVVNLLTWEQHQLADAFAGQAPAPGGVFRLGEWTESEWGPVLLGSAGWIGARLSAEAPDHAGWGLLVRATVEHVQLPDPAPDHGVLLHTRGRYRSLGPDGAA